MYTSPHENMYYSVRYFRRYFIADNYLVQGCYLGPHS